MTNAQNWLDNTISLDQRRRVKQLLIYSSVSSEETQRNPFLHFQERYDRNGQTRTYYLDANGGLLTGTLNLSDFTQLKILAINDQWIDNIILTNCNGLKTLNLRNNLLQTITFPQIAPQLQRIGLENNDFLIQDLSQFATFTNLTYLGLGTNCQTSIRHNVYNRFTGSLEHLQNLTKLKGLNINATDINSGLEYLPTRHLAWFLFGNRGRIGAGVDQISNELINSGSLQLENGQTLEEWTLDEDIEQDLNKIGIIEEWRKWKIRQNRQQQQYQNQIQINNNQNI